MNIGLGIGIPFTRSSLWASIFTPSALFLDGSTQGVWYDPSDNTTLFQDAAGTIPVTAVEQPVGLMKDKSGRGNHAFNSSGNSANFPVLSARVNLLTKTEDISTAVWSKSGTSAPNADTLLELAASGVHRVTQSINAPATKCCLYAEFYPAGRSSCSLSLYDASGGTTRVGAIFSIDGAGSIISGASALNKISLLPDGWYGCYIESTSAFSGGNAVANIGATNGAAESYTGDATKGVRVRKVDFRPIGTGVNLPAYQRVNTATDYDTVGFKTYLRFNGTNQWLQTNSIDFTYGDKMFVCAGVRKLSGVSTGAIVELGVSPTTAGYFGLRSRGYASDDYALLLRGLSGNTIQNYLTYTAPVTNVVSGVFDQAGTAVDTELVFRANGVVSGKGGTTVGPNGNTTFVNGGFYIGASAGTSLFFNGNLHQLVIAGKQASAAEITATESFINQKTGAY